MMATSAATPIGQTTIATTAALLNFVFFAKMMSFIYFIV